MNKTSAVLIRTLLLGTSCLSVFAAGSALADPTGGNVVYGAATITNRGNNTTVIDQTTGKAVINWNSFSIAAGGTVRFNQPGSGSIALNRVIGSESSAIYGSLLANGQVWLINGNGILFGGGSKINVGGLIATTSDIANGDFAAGNYSFSGGTGASVVNDGSIRAKNGGSVVLSGASVSNHGLVAADAGTVVLGGASAFTVDFVGDGLLKYAITAPAAKPDGNAPAGVSNSGTLSAAGGRIVMTARAAANVADAVVNNTGMISATSAKLQNGEVVLDAGDGDVAVSGSIDASGTGNGQTGGSVAITGRNITVADNTQINVSGDAGGGSVRIGGDAHGAGTLAHAANVHIGTATIRADAIRKGNGGTLVVWSNGLTDFSGIVSALGGAAGGNGGFVETSGHTLSVGAQAHVDTRAPHGATGTWLLDPETIIIANSGTTPIIGGTLSLDQDSENTDTVSPAAIVTALSTTNVSLQASNAIQIEDAVIYNSANSLSLLSQGSITVGADIQNSGSGDINLIAGWDGTTTNPASFTTAGVYGIGEGSGYIEFSNDAAVGSFGGTTTFAADSVIMGIYGTHTQIGYKGAEGGGGDIEVLTTGDLSLSIYNGGTVQIGNGSIYNAIGGDVTGNVTISAGGTLNLTEYSGTIIMGSRATEGHVATSNFTLTAADRNESGNALTNSIEGDIVGGDVSITIQSNLSGIGPLSYTSDHTLSLSTQGDLNIDHAITNLGAGAIELTADGNITQNPANCFDGAAITAAALDATSNGGDVTLDDQGNAIASASLSAAGNVTLINSTDITLTSVFAGGSVYVSTDFEGAESGAITIDGQITALGGDGCEGACIDLEAVDGISETANGLLTGTGLYVSSEAGDVTLNNEANSVDGEVHLYAAGSVSFVDFSGFTMEDGGSGTTFTIQSLNGGIEFDDEIDVGGAMTVTAHDDITETGDADLEGGDLTLTSTNGAIHLLDGEHDFDGTISLNASGDVQFFNDDATVLGASTVGGQLYVISNGDVTQSAAIVAGSLAIEAGDLFCFSDCTNSNVTLTDSGNTIAGDVAFNVTGDVAFTDAVGFSLGRVVFAFDDSVSHTFIGGDLTATALTGGITINGGVETGLNGLDCGCGGDDSDPTLTAAGDITETYYGYINGGDLNATSTGGTISLLGQNDLFGTVSLNAAGDALFHNEEGVTLGASTVGGTLYIDAIGDVTQSGVLTATNLAIKAVAPECGCDTGSVVLDNPANAISGTVAFQADGDVTFVNSGSFTLADVSFTTPSNQVINVTNSIGGDLTATSLGGGITIDGQVATNPGFDPVLTAAGDIVETENGSIVGGDLTVTSTGGNIVLVNANNDLTGTVSLSAFGNAAFANDTDITLGATAVAGDLLVLSQGNITVVRSIQNAGDGAITLVAGWDGLYDPSRVGAFGTYGLNGGSITVGGVTAAGNVAVGSAQGALALYGSSLTLSADNGYAQVGYHGAGGGDISVRMTHDINGFGNGANPFSLQLGNGTLANDVVGDVTGNISLDAGGQTVFISQVGVSWLGNHAAAGFKETGDITSLSTTGSYSADYIEADLGTSADTGGNFFIGFRNNPDALGFRVGGIEYTSPHSLVFATAASLDVVGSVINHGTGDVTLVSGWDSETVGSGDVIRAAGAYGLNGTHMNVGGDHHYQIGDFQFDNNQFENISVGSAGGLTSILAGGLTIAPSAGFYAQLGYHGTGGGAIVVAARGDLTMTAGANAHDYAMIGNGSLLGDVTGNITGNIDINVGGTTVLNSTPGATKAWIGNVAGSGFHETGNVQLVTFDLGHASQLGAMVASDLGGGDVTIAITDTAASNTIDDPLSYNSAHTLSLLTAGSLTFNASVQNAGTGAINVVAGWDGVTFDAAHFADAGVFGRNSGAVVIGGAQASGNVAVGSAGGQTNLAANTLLVAGINGYAQLGYHGIAAGVITVNALGAVMLTGGSAADYGQIGNGTVFGSNATGGDVSISAASIGGSLNTAVTANNLKLAAASGGIGASGSPLRIASASLSLQTSGGAVFLTSPGNAVSFGGTGVNLAGGSLSLAAGGPISQTAAIHTGNLTISTTSGAIILTNAGNMFGGLTVTTSGSDNASFAHASFIGVTSANVGGTLTLTAAGNISQSGAIHAASLNVTSSGGTITLTNTGNSFATLSVTTSGTNAASLADASAVTLAGANVGGSFTLAAGGAVSQTGAIHTGALSVSTSSGAIVLNNAANTFTSLTAVTHGTDNASIAHAGNLVVAGATVGGTLTLAAGGAVSQTGGILSGGLVVSSGGAITLTNGANSFATLSLTTSAGNNASVFDASAVTLGGATVGGSFTLAAGGAIGQSAALHTGALSVSTSSGAIVLNNAANTFTSLTAVTHGTDNASIAHAGALVVAGATVGGTLTLTAGGGVSQTGGILSGGLAVSSGGVVTLTNSANSFATLSLTTSAGNNASVFDASAVTLGGATVGGSFTLAAGGAIGQTGAIVASALTVSTTSGAITLSNSGNAFATLSVATAGSDDAAFADSTALTLASATVGGKLTLAAGGTIGQTGAIVAHALTVSTSAGAITLAKATNAVSGTVQLSTPGSAIFANSLALNVGASSVGGDLTLLSKGNINVIAPVQSTTGAITVVAGWDGTTTDPSAIGNAGAYGNNNGNITIGGTGTTGNVALGSKTGTTSLYASNVNLIGANGYAQLGYHGTGGGAIKLAALHNLTLSGGSGYAMIGNGSFGSDVTGNVTGDIDIRVGGSAIFNSVGTATQAWVGNKTASGSETGNLILLAADNGGSQDCDLGCFAQADIVGGDVTLGVTSGGDQVIDGSIVYNSAHTLNLLIGGGLAITGSLQNAGTGAINLVTGWDGHTLSNFGAAGVFGNNAKGVVIGGAGAAGNAAFGSAGGTTSIWGASLVLSAVHGYAQLGFNGHGSGAIVVNVTGGVTLTGGSGDGQFVQIGNGGLKTSGNNSGDIAINAGGDVALTAGAGAEAYAQIGHGGAESNTGANGYSNVAAIQVTAANVLLAAGAGGGSYVQIGNGGYKSGLNLAGGTANNGGDITITAAHTVSLLGNGADAYAQIGNGGSQSNLNAAASAGGSDSGNIVVHAPNGGAGSVTLAAGAGANAYVQIGNGGYAVNSGPTSTVANWTVTGNVSVTDLSLTGNGLNSYAQIGNGDASLNSVGNVSGNITIDANGQITYTNGTGLHSPATIGNFTGLGTVSGTLTGAQPPSDIANNPVIIGVVVGNTPDNGAPGGVVPVIPTVTIGDGEENDGGATKLASLAQPKPGPLASLDDNGADSASPNTADSATVIIADSLNGAVKASSSQSILAGMLKQTGTASGAAHGVPPADQDFSSWGNEALWQ